MKIAEALLLKADMDSKIASLTDRIGKYSIVQEGSKPHEDPAKLIARVEAVVADRFDLVRRIDEANARARTSDGRTIAAALNQREALRWRIQILKKAISASQKQPDTYRITELRWVAVIDVEAVQNDLDELARQVREANAVIQEANWREELE